MYYSGDHLRFQIDIENRNLVKDFPMISLGSASSLVSERRSFEILDNQEHILVLANPC